jgi:hypothetical protein
MLFLHYPEVGRQKKTILQNPKTSFTKSNNIFFPVPSQVRSLEKACLHFSIFITRVVPRLLGFCCLKIQKYFGFWPNDKGDSHHSFGDEGGRGWPWLWGYPLHPRATAMHVPLTLIFKIR